MDLKPPSTAVRWSVATVAFCVLAYEISLTRIFSVLFRSPYVFLILSIAVCGLGLGSALAALWDDEDADRALGAPLLAFALALPLPLLLLLTLGRPLIAGAKGPAVAVLTALPYLAAGLFLARAFRRHADDSGRLYFCDLGGAALAALVAAQLVTHLGGTAVPAALGALAALAALVLNRRSGARLGAGAVLVGSLVLVAVQQQPNRLTLPPITCHDESLQPLIKPLFQELADPSQGSQLRYTEWSPVARTDVVSNKGSDTLYIWTDGDVPTQMEPFKGGDLTPMLRYTPPVGIAGYALRPKPERVLCIGPGGGLDVLIALLGGAKHIEPVEINPAIARVVHKFRDFYGDLYKRPEIDPGLIIDEGRSYLTRTTHRYDMIYFALAKSATTQQGGLALVDNYLYTTEAFQDYYRHLTDRGVLALVFANPVLVDRCFVTASAALMQLGLKGSDIADRLAYMGIPAKYHQATPYQFVLLLSKQPLSAQERQGLARFAKRAELEVRYIPTVAEREPYSKLREPGMTAAGFTKAVADQDYYLTRYGDGPLVRLNPSPVTDDHPFYADLAPGLNPMLVPLLRGSLWIGVLVLVLAWVLARRQSGERFEPVLPLLYFAGLGGGFLLVEVALIQKLVLVLGYPTLSLTVLLFTLLLGGAAGGQAANRGSATEAARRLPVVFGAVIALQVVYAFGLTPLGTRVLAAALPVRVAVVAALVLPLGFLMGQPYPTGLRLLGAQRPAWVPLAWAVNGVLSVTGSVVAAAAASLFGYRAVMLLGAVIYLVTALVGQAWCRRPAQVGAV